jgi:hypothetical protein
MQIKMAIKINDAQQPTKGIKPRKKPKSGRPQEKLPLLLRRLNTSTDLMVLHVSNKKIFGIWSYGPDYTEIKY